MQTSQEKQRQLLLLIDTHSNQCFQAFFTKTLHSRLGSRRMPTSGSCGRVFARLSEAFSTKQEGG